MLRPLQIECNNVDSWCHYFGVLFGVYYTLSDPLEKASMSDVKITGINKEEGNFAMQVARSHRVLVVKEVCRLPLVLYVLLDSF